MLVADKLDEYEDIRSFGQQLGIAYQIKDDILDYMVILKKLENYQVMKI